MRTSLIPGLIITFLACLLAACTGQGQPSLLPITQFPGTAPTFDPTLRATEPTGLAVTATSQVISSQPATPTPGGVSSPNTHYTLTAELDYNLHDLSVQEQIVYTNRTSEPIPELLLIVEPSRYPGTFQLSELTLDEKLVANFIQDIGHLRIPLDQPLSPGDKLRLNLAYDLHLPSPDPSFYGRPVPFGYSERQTNLVDWYPFFPPYVPGQGWLAHEASLWGEFLVYEVADYQVNLRLKDSRQDLTVAASSPAQRDGDWYRYQHPEARNFVWSVSHQYQLSTAQVGAVTVYGYAFSVHAQAGAAALQATVEALDLYTKIYGPYPRQALSLVEADFLDGMEYDGLYFLSKGFYNIYTGTPAEYLWAIAAHETAHQWYYAQVGNDQALEPWLDEALCTYSERLYYEKVHPEALDWWWDYRVYYYEPKGWVDGSVYNPEGYRAYRDAVYLNGALFLEDLRSLVGDQAFFAFLQAYVKRYAGKIATSDNFFTMLNEYTQANLQPLLDKYFRER